jgi:hypothetical protein
LIEEIFAGRFCTGTTPFSIEFLQRKTGNELLAGFFFSAQLTARCRDILALALPDDGCEVVLHQDLLKLKNAVGRRGIQRQSRMRVERDEIDLGPDALEQLDKLCGVLFLVINPVYQDVFESDHAPVREREFLARGNEAL